MFFVKIIEHHDYESLFLKKTTSLFMVWTQERYDCSWKLLAAILMHPAPVNRDVEIADHLVGAPKSPHFQNNDQRCLCPYGHH